MSVKDAEENMKFSIIETDGTIQELMMVAGGNKGFIMLSLYGEIDLNNISKIAQEMRIEGMERLGKMEKKHEEHHNDRTKHGAGVVAGAARGQRQHDVDGDQRHPRQRRERVKEKPRSPQTRVETEVEEIVSTHRQADGKAGQDSHYRNRGARHAGRPPRRSSAGDHPR